MRVWYERSQKRSQRFERKTFSRYNSRHIPDRRKKCIEIYLASWLTKTSVRLLRHRICFVIIIVKLFNSKNTDFVKKRLGSKLRSKKSRKETQSLQRDSTGILPTFYRRHRWKGTFWKPENQQLQSVLMRSHNQN